METDPPPEGFLVNNSDPDVMNVSTDSGRNVYKVADKNAPITKSRNTARMRIDSSGVLLYNCCPMLQAATRAPPTSSEIKKPGFKYSI